MLLIVYPSCGPQEHSSGGKPRNEDVSPPSMAKLIAAMAERSRDFGWIEADHKPEEAGDSIRTKFRESGWAYSNWVDGELPRTEWPSAIVTLDPLIVYPDGVNAVIMMSDEDNVERGYYVEMPHSSRAIMFDSMDPGSLSYRTGDDDEWVFKHLGFSVYAYTRTRANKSELLTPARS